MDQSTDVVEQLIAELRSVKGELAAVRDRLAELEASRPPGRAVERPVSTSPTTIADPVVSPDGDGRTSRRRLLGTVAAGTAAAVVGVVATSEPAAAGTGAMQYGANNNAGDFFTGIQSSNTTATFSSTQTGGLGDALVAYNSGGGRALYVESTGSLGARVVGADAGLTAVGSSTGVSGSGATGAGVFGSSEAGNGVSGSTSSGLAGVNGSTVTTVGVAGQVGDGTSISRPAKVGVLGDSTTLGVVGLTTGGTGVKGQASGGTGVNGLSSTGTGVLGSVSGTTSTTAAVRGTTAGNGQGGLFTLSTAASTGSAVKAVGDHAQLTLAPLTEARKAPIADAVAHARGELLVDGSGDLWLCVVAGTPGTWRKVGGPSTAGQLHLLSAPVRIYDSRPGSSPVVGDKVKLSPGVARVLDAKVNSSGVPAGATAILAYLLVVGAPAGSGNFTIWANGVARPSSNAMVWGGDAGRFSTLAVTALDSAGRFQVSASVATDVVVDVVGFAR